MAKTYINGKYLSDNTETIDEFESHKEAREMLEEYRVSFGPDYRLWLSSRSTKDWRES